MKKKYYFMDVLRVLAMLLIVYYHLFIELFVVGAREVNAFSNFYENKNAHLATIGVGIFFMLSGFGLMLSSQNREFRAGAFYKHRLIKILVPFYLVNILCFLSILGIKLCLGRDLSVLFPKRITILRPFSMVLGMGQYFLLMMGETSYVRYFGDTQLMYGIGDWFIGCLILMYIVFPLLRKALLKNRWITLCGTTLYFVLVLVFYDKFSFFDSTSGTSYCNFFVKIYDFILGMFLATVVKEIPRWVVWPSLAVILAYAFSPVEFPLFFDLSIVLLNTAILLIFLCMEPVFSKAKKPMKVISFLGSYTYYFFLVHHVTIHLISEKWVERCNTKGVPLSDKEIPLLFLIELVTCVVFTCIVAFLMKIPSKLRNKKAEAVKEEKEG